MLNRAKYFHQLSNSIDSAFRQISNTMGELNNKEASSQTNLAMSKLGPEMTRRYTTLINDPNMAPDEMEEAWNNNFQELQDFALEGVTNKNAQEAVSQKLGMNFANYTSNVINSSIQKKADNIKLDTTLAITNVFEGYTPKDKPQKFIDERIKPLLGYTSGGVTDPVLKLTDPIFSVADTERLVEAYTREAFTTDAAVDIDMLLDSDMTRDGVTGYAAANEIIDTGDFTKAEKKGLRADLEVKHAEIQRIRNNEATAFNQEAHDTFMPGVIAGEYPSREDVTDFYEKYPIPIDVQDGLANWMDIVITHEANNEVNTLLSSFHGGEEISLENISPEAKLMLGEENLAIMGSSEKTPSGNVQGTSLSGGSSSGKIQLPGLNKSSSVVLQELKNMYFNPSFSSEDLTETVRANMGALSKSDISKYLNTSTRDALLQSDEYKALTTHNKERVTLYYKDKDSVPSLSQQSVTTWLNEAAWKTLIQNPDMNMNEYSAEIDTLFKDFVMKDILKELEQMEDLRGGGETLYEDLENIDDYEELTGALQEGKFSGLVDMDIIGEYLREGLTEGTEGGIAETLSMKIWGQSYEDIKKDKVRKNITDLNVVIASSFSLTEDLFKKEVAPEIGDYISVTSSRGLIFIGENGYAYRSRLGESGKAEIWEQANIGEEYYENKLRGKRLKEPLPDNITWQKTKYSTIYASKKRMAAAEKAGAEALGKKTGKAQQKEPYELYDVDTSPEKSFLSNTIGDTPLFEVIKDFTSNVVKQGSEFVQTNILDSAAKAWALSTRPESEIQKYKQEEAGEELKKAEKSQRDLTFEMLTPEQHLELAEYLRESQEARMVHHEPLR